MALHGTLEEGVRPAEVWLAWKQLVPDPKMLATCTGWSMDVILTIDSYQDSLATYSFPTMDELKQSLQAYFQIINFHIPGYELGDRCPLFELSPKCVS